MCVYVCVCVCVSVLVLVHMQPGVIYVQCPVLYASCVMLLTPLPTSVLVIIQMIHVSQGQWSQTL
jgi:hypothetical protein